MPVHMEGTAARHMPHAAPHHAGALAEAAHAAAAAAVADSVRRGAAVACPRLYHSLLFSLLSLCTILITTPNC